MSGYVSEDVVLELCRQIAAGAITEEQARQFLDVAAGVRDAPLGELRDDEAIAAADAVLDELERGR